MTNPFANTAKLVLAATIVGAASARVGVASAQTINNSQAKPTIVLVHGAFADASSWNGEVALLQNDGYTVIAPPNELRGIANDAKSVASLLASIKGPIVLVGHSYGGPVIESAAAGNANVKALVFVSAYALDAGESVAGLGEKFPDTQLTPAVLTKVPFDNQGHQDLDLYVNTDAFESVFANGLPKSQSVIMAATQRPLALGALNEKATEPAWKTIPSWAVLSANDLVIPPDEQQFMYGRIKAKVTRVDAGHTALVSHPDVVVKVIEEAANATK
ncbi:MAG TPA: alpha/beta hydrolase [Candidatus Tumulicola sp.]|jgi:pimeloyl-ACP methyl ester carboxylesterase